MGTASEGKLLIRLHHGVVPTHRYKGTWKSCTFRLSPHDGALQRRGSAGSWSYALKSGRAMPKIGVKRLSRSCKARAADDTSHGRTLIADR
jgi:hypothetical protein